MGDGITGESTQEAPSALRLLGLGGSFDMRVIAPHRAFSLVSGTESGPRVRSGSKKLILPQCQSTFTLSSLQHVSLCFERLKTPVSEA